MTAATLSRVGAPTLFLAGKDDYGAAGAARLFSRWAKRPKELEIVDSYEHGTALFAADPPIRARVKEIVMAFLARYAPISQ